MKTSPVLEEDDIRTGTDENFAEESRDEKNPEPDGLLSKEDHPPGEITFSVFLYQPWYRKEIQVGLFEGLETSEALEVLPENQWLQLTAPKPSFILKWERIHSSKEDLEMGMLGITPDDFAEESTAIVYIFQNTNGKANDLLALPPRKEQPSNHFLLVNLTSEKLTWQASDAAPPISPSSYLSAPLPNTNIRFQGSTSGSSLILNRRSFASSGGIVLIMPPLRGTRGEFQYRLLQWPRAY
ncbi:MAG: hypothetical protein JJT75_02230 [Opitutales bacterium]|nr:hypothetical protein [Opitutales bacterium]